MSSMSTERASRAQRAAAGVDARVHAQVREQHEAGEDGAVRVLGVSVGVAHHGVCERVDKKGGVAQPLPFELARRVAGGQRKGEGGAREVAHRLERGDGEPRRHPPVGRNQDEDGEQREKALSALVGVACARFERRGLDHGRGQDE